MVVQAYILIQTEVGQASEVAREIGQLAGVTMAEDVTGPSLRRGRSGVSGAKAVGVPAGHATVSHGRRARAQCALAHPA